MHHEGGGGEVKAEYRDGKLNQEWNGRKNIVIDGGKTGDISFFGR